MSDLNNDLEAMLGDMVMSEDNQQPVEATQEEQVQDEPQTDDVTTQEPVQEEVQQERAPVETQPEIITKEEQPISAEEKESVMLEYLSERLGRKVSSFDEVQGNQNTSVEIDERVTAINEFVKQTGRDPQDWFAYQAMNPSEMDDVSAVKIQLKNQYGDLSDSDLQLLIDNKYKLDADLYDDSEIRLSQLQLKMDSGKARQEIENLRSQYATPVKKAQQEEEFNGIVNDEWLGNMSTEVDALDGIEFEVSKDKSFTFGLEDNYKSKLKSKNENIEDFFSAYVGQEGQWDFEKWNMHQTVVDNIETIVKTAYQQGLGEGQRGLVDKAANVQYNQPNEAANTGQGNSASVEEQLRQALGLNDNGLTFKNKTKRKWQD
tara:strand:- start:1852 stop:2976 length:1125 start_codon:yes stop_codon:yes gene_type:complete